MKITCWTFYGDQNYKSIDIADKIEYSYENVSRFITEEIKKRGYKFSGYYHHKGQFGCPVLDDTYLVVFTQRGWGQIMEDAYHEHPDDPMAYAYWAFMDPVGSTEVYPSEEDWTKEIPDEQDGEDDLEELSKEFDFSEEILNMNDDFEF
jgi:hypothetical protein